MRTALSLLITRAGLNVVEECVNQPEALRHYAKRVDVVVMDLDLDSRRVAQMEPLLAALNGTAVLIVTHHDHPAAAAAAMRKGAAGVVLKSRPADVFLRAIHVVLAGGVWVERSTAARAHEEAIVRRQLTRREAEIVELVSQGLQNKMIAEQLSITATTVRHHLTSIFEKLSVTNRMELMRFTYGGPQTTAPVVRP